MLQFLRRHHIDEVIKQRASKTTLLSAPTIAEIKVMTVMLVITRFRTGL
jgi:hypothetical protein